MVCKQRTTFIILGCVEYLILTCEMNALRMYSLSNKHTACRDGLPSIKISSAMIYVIQLLEKIIQILFALKITTNYHYYKVSQYYQSYT